MNFPQKKPKKTTPVRSTITVIPRIGDRVLMEKRPPTGIWGGLWCFLEISSMEQLPELLSKHNLLMEDKQQLDTFRHTFSHFHLDISPVIISCTLSNSQQIHDNSQQKWYDLSTPASVGFAASTDKLINEVKQQHIIT